MEDDDFIVTIDDARAAQLCNRGSRAWAAAYGLSWNDFITHGISARRLESLNDAFANRAVAAARRRLGK